MFVAPLAVVSNRTVSKTPTLNDGSTEEVGPLGDGATDQDSAGASALAGQLSRRGVSLTDQVISASDEVAPGVGFRRSFAGQVPLLPVLPAATPVADRPHSASFVPRQRLGIEVG